MDAHIGKGEGSRRGSTAFLHKGKSDSLVPRWASLETQSQGETISTIANRKGSATHLRCSQALYVGQSECDPSSAFNSHSTRISRASSANLSLCISGPAFAVPTDHAAVSIVDGSKGRREEEEAPDSNEMDFGSNARKGSTIQELEHEKHALPSGDNFSINIDYHRFPPPPPISLKFVDVKYKVGVNDERSRWMGSCWRLMNRAWRCGGGGGAKVGVKKRRYLLKGVTGKVEAGEVLALMGPSGSGKTTLINLLSGRLQHHLEAGSITYNDMPYCKALKPRMGFVMQDDILYPHLTVKETLVYAALLRLSKKLSKRESIERAIEVISELGLDRCQDTIIGGAFLRGVSGGERKRVCMGQEILINPSILFLDEPTSGLDSTTALRIMKLLKEIAEGGRTVVTTVHQPSGKLFTMFNKLVVLSEGHSIYYGRASAAMEYFSSIGFSPQSSMNPADFLLDLASGNVSDILLPSRLLAEQTLTDANPTRQAPGDAPHTRPPSKIIRHYVSKVYNEAAWEEGQSRRLLESMLAEKELHVTAHDRETAQRVMKEREWSSTWWSQFWVLYGRGLRERRHDYLSCLRFLQVIASALVIGCLWWHSSLHTERQLVDQVGLLFFIATYWGFFPLFTALFTFPQERAILAKERASDMYRLSAYFMARTLGDIPLDFCLPFLFHIIVYFMAQLRPTAPAFFLTLFTILLSTVTSQSMGIAIGAILMDLKKATTLSSVTLLTFMLSGGFFVQNIPRFISWIQFVSYNYHTFKLLIKVQYDNQQQLDCATPNGCQKVIDSAFFKSLSLDGGHNEVLVLISMVVGYRVLAYIALRQMRLVV